MTIGIALIGCGQIAEAHLKATVSLSTTVGPGSTNSPPPMS